MSEVKEKLSVEQIRDRLIEKLSPGGWSDLLKGFLRSSDFEKIIAFLIKENESGRRFTPALKQIFRAMELCPVDKVKVVMIGQDPYPQPAVADGIAFSCGNTGKPEASLRYILNSIETTVPPEDKDFVEESERCDLSRWSKKGVLLMNAALTTEVTKTGKHSDIWRPFLEYVIDMLNFKQSGLVWVLMGKQAQSFESLIGEHHMVFTTTHPAYAAYLRSPSWDCNDVFNKVNKQLLEYKKEKILW
jgi:uracil-DNA glycosylase